MFDESLQKFVHRQPRVPRRMAQAAYSSVSDDRAPFGEPAGALDAGILDAHAAPADAKHRMRWSCNAARKTTAVQELADATLAWSVSGGVCGRRGKFARSS